MRFAVLIAPFGEDAAPGERPASLERAAQAGSGAPRTGNLAHFEALRAALMLGGFNVLRLSTSSHLARDLERAIDGVDAGDSLLVHVAGALEVEGDAAVGLRLPPGPREASAEEVPADGAARAAGEVVASTLRFRFDALADMVRAKRLADTLLVLDLSDDAPADDAMRAAEHVDTALHAMRAREEALGVLVGVHGTRARGADDAQGEARHTSRAWPLTGFVAGALRDAAARDSGGAWRVSSVVARMRELPELSVAVASFALVRGTTDFVLAEGGPGDGAIGRASSPSISPPSPSPSAGPSSLRGRPSRPPRSVVPLPAIEPILAEAERAQASGRWDDALDGYKKALMLLGEGDLAVRASLYASFGEVKRSQGKTREAETNFEKALAADPRHRRSIEALVAMATEARDWARAVGFRRRLVATLDGDAPKASELGRIADLLETEAHDPRAALEALEEARERTPNDASLLRRLRGLYAFTNRWAKVAEVSGVLAGQAPLATERAELLFEQADVALGRLRDEAQGLQLLESALDQVPAHERALAALIAVRTRRGEWQELERVNVRLIDRFAEGGDPAHAWDACRRLASLRRDKLHDGPGAIDALRGALRCKASDVESRAALAELLVAKGDAAAAVAELEIAAEHEPTRASTHRRLFELHRRTGATDRAWLAATALEELGALNVDHDMMVQQFRGVGRASAALGDDAWRGALRAPGADEAVAQVFRAIAPAAIAMRVAELRDERKLVHLDPDARQAETSTASIVRTFAWASQVLGVAEPALYVLPEVPGGLAAAQVASPSTAIGPSVVSGKSVPELAFIAARHLAYYRPEHYVLVFFPSLAELTALFLAAVRLAMPRVTAAAGAEGAAARIGRQLERHVTPPGRIAVAEAVGALDARGGKADLGAWIRSVELTATRAGLLVCGDLKVAMGVLRSESRLIADLGLEDKRKDLLAFTASSTLAELRAAIGVAARSSLVPPASTSSSSRPPAPAPLVAPVDMSAAARTSSDPFPSDHTPSDPFPRTQDHPNG